MFNLTPIQVAEKINTLTFEEKMVLLTGVSLPALEIIQKLFPEDSFIAWVIHTKKETNFR